VHCGKHCLLIWAAGNSRCFFSGRVRQQPLLLHQALGNSLWMPIYCDESGGVSAGVMTLAAVHMSATNSEKLLARFRTVTGLHGELKGSRIDYTERGLFFELFDRYDAHGIIAAIDLRGLERMGLVQSDEDYGVYAELMARAVSTHLSDPSRRDTVIIDEGRYNYQTLELVRNGINTLLRQSGDAAAHQTQFADSRRCPGVQIADVVANTFYNAMVGGHRGGWMERIVAPFTALDRVAIVTINPHKMVARWNRPRTGLQSG
jgi:hypothetical protein